MSAPSPSGRIFEIREFTLHDGPGVRTTVFLKGCPLRCAWCHNPEGQSFEVETMTRKDGSHVRCGEDWAAAALATELLKNADIMLQSGGGVTFSGGEPLAQADFVEAVTDLLHAEGISVAIETSGACAGEAYRRVVGKLDFVYQDLKHHDPETFARGCVASGGADSNQAIFSTILENVDWLRASGIQRVFRVPCIPGYNDTAADRAAFERLVPGEVIEYLPYNPAAAAKYPMLGRHYLAEH